MSAGSNNTGNKKKFGFSGNKRTSTYIWGLAFLKDDKDDRMKIIEFQSFIQEIPYKLQSFDIKKENWKFENQQKLIDKIFEGNTTITINRDDLINSSWNTKEFIVKTLMWGYPTRARAQY